jgi:hypothetical protein
VRSRIDHLGRRIVPADVSSRHVMLFSLGGVFTVLERVGAGAAGDHYILRYHATAERADMTVFDIGTPSAQRSWTGFRYHGTEWSFVEQTPLRIVD